MVNIEGRNKSTEFVAYSYLVGVEAEAHTRRSVNNASSNGLAAGVQFSPITTTHSPTRQIFNRVLSHISYKNQINTFTGERIQQLSYTGHGCQEIPESLGKFYGSRIQIFDLSYNSLQSLQGLENFDQLTELIVDNNAIDDNLSIPYLPHLHTLSLNKNNISNLQSLIDQVSNKLPNLTYLSLLGNPACPDQLTNREQDENDYLRYREDFVVSVNPVLMVPNFPGIGKKH